MPRVSALVDHQGIGQGRVVFFDDPGRWSSSPLRSSISEVSALPGAWKRASEIEVSWNGTHRRGRRRRKWSRWRESNAVPGAAQSLATGTTRAVRAPPSAPKKRRQPGRRAPGNATSAPIASARAPLEAGGPRRGRPRAARKAQP